MENPRREKKVFRPRRWSKLRKKKKRTLEKKKRRGGGGRGSGRSVLKWENCARYTTTSGPIETKGLKPHWLNERQGMGKGSPKKRGDLSKLGNSRQEKPKAKAREKSCELPKKKEENVQRGHRLSLEQKARRTGKKKKKNEEVPYESREEGSLLSMRGKLPKQKRRGRNQQKEHEMKRLLQRGKGDC